MLALHKLVFVQQDSLGFFRILGVYWTVEQFCAVQEHLDEGWTHGERALDQRFGERVFDVLLQSAA